MISLFCHREQWIKGFGAPIKSWTQSLTSFDDSENLSHYLKGILDKKGYFKSVIANQIQWKKFGDYFLRKVCFVLLFFMVEGRSIYRVSK